MSHSLLTTIASMASSCSGRSQRINSIQKLKLLGDIPRYDLYYSLTYSLKWKPFVFKTCTSLHYLVLNFYQINEDGEIQSYDRLVIKALISYQITNSTQKLKLLGEVSKYDLYYFLIVGRGVYISKRVRRNRYCQSILFRKVLRWGNWRRNLAPIFHTNKQIFWGWKSTTITKKSSVNHLICRHLLQHSTIHEQCFTHINIRVPLIVWSLRAHHSHIYATFYIFYFYLLNLTIHYSSMQIRTCPVTYF
jgi:hypothetical protein